MNNKKILIFELFFTLLVIVIKIETVNADQQLQDNNLKIKTERIITNKSTTDKNVSNDSTLFDKQSSQNRKNIQKNNNKQLNSGRDEIFKKYYQKSKIVSTKNLFEKKSSTGIKTSKSKPTNNTSIIGGIVSGISAIGAGLGLSFGTLRKG